MAIPVDTLVCDTARIAAWQQTDAFDYNREMIEPQQNILEWLFQLIMGFLNEMFTSVMSIDLSRYIIAGVALLLVGLTILLLYKYRPSLFRRDKKDNLDYELEEDTIYGIDFDAAIAEALGRKDYREAVRLTYLKTLKLLTEAEQIDWQLHKTPTQYTYEFQNESFRRMTTLFLRIRYGNFEATKDVYDEMVAAHLSLVTPHLSQKKGGDI